MTCKAHDKIKKENQDLFELLRLADRRVVVLKDRIKELERQHEFLSERVYPSISMRDWMIIVSGYRRCGTSCMMQALNAGGIGLIHVPELEGGNPNYNGYQPNPGGLYEMGLGQYMCAKLLRMLPNKGAIKILFDGLPCLPQGDYKIIFMSRDVDEIDMSTKRVDEHILGQPGRQRGLASRVDEITGILPFCTYRPYNQDDIDHVLGICDARADMKVMHLDYLDVIHEPLNTFNWLKTNGIPIDPEKAAAVVNPKLYRIRKEVKDDHSKSRISRNNPESNCNAQPTSQKATVTGK